MHIQHSVHIDRPINECASALAEAAPTWFPRLKAKGKASVGVKVAGLPLRKGVTVEVGTPMKAGDWTNVPITWKATGPKALFPVMNGRIELVPSGTSETRLTVSGMYEPPLGKLGAQLDQALMHNVAEGTVRELAEAIAKKLGG
jgi:carbon monoxide dehydrogenase subunit G